MEVTQNIDFHHYWCILQRRWLPAVAAFTTVVGLTYIYTSAKSPIYQAQGQLLFKQDQSSSLIGLESATQVNPTNQSDTSLATEAKVIRSVPILQQALEQINNEPQGATISLENLQQGLDVIAVEGTDILQIIYKGEDPLQATLIVNQLMNVYVNKNLLNNRAAAISAGNFITSQLPKVKANLHQADLAVRKFKEKNKITDITQTQEIFANNTERVSAQIDTVEAQLVDVTSRAQSLQSQLGMNPQQAMTVASLSQSSAVQGTLTELQEVQRRTAEARSRYRDNHPTITSLAERKTELQILLESQIAQVLQSKNQKNRNTIQLGAIQQQLIADLITLEVNRLGLVAQQATLMKQQEAYLQKATKLPQLEQQQRELERELSAAQSTYEALLKSLQEIKVIENRTVGNVRIIEHAQMPTGAINASNSSAMAAGSLAGLLIAGAIIYVLEITDIKIKTVKEAREIFEYNLIATIPLFNPDKSQENQKNWQVPVLTEPRSFISESYRMLLANLKFSPGVDRAFKVILITSSVPQEGKSTTCANLAAIMAHLNYKVLIVDTDLQHPSQHQIWNISNEYGLINALSKKLGISKNIQSVAKNIDVLTAGSSQSNSIVLLDYRSMTSIIEQYSRQYDYILIDTPPLSATADASILSKIADGTIMVIRPGIADINSSKSAKEYLDQSSQNILGIVINGVTLGNEPYSYRQYTKENDNELKASYWKNRFDNFLDTFKRRL